MSTRTTTFLGAGALASAAAVAASLVLGASGAAATPSSTPGARPATPKASPATLSEIQAKAAAAIGERVHSLEAAVAKVEADKALGTDGGTLVAYLQQDISPLQDLGAKIASDTTVSQARADYRAIFVDYRVYVLVLPAAWQAARADAISVTVVPRLTALSAKAQARVTPQNQATLGPMIASLNSDISGASSASSGVAGTVLGYTPAQWNADHSLLSATRASLQSAVSDVKSARSELRQIRRYLRSNRASARSRARSTTTGA
jgi:hypothetical protein